MIFLVTFPLTQVIVFFFFTTGFGVAETLLPDTADGEGDEVGVGAEIATCDSEFWAGVGVGAGLTVAELSEVDCED